MKKERSGGGKKEQNRNFRGFGGQKGCPNFQYSKNQVRKGRESRGEGREKSRTNERRKRKAAEKSNVPEEEDPDQIRGAG